MSSLETNSIAKTKLVAFKLAPEGAFRPPRPSFQEFAV